MNYLFDVPVPGVPIEGSDKVFPIRRIYCVGRNYVDHAREMGHDPDREPPFFFMKPADAYVPSGATLTFPQVTKDLHHEIELVVAIDKTGADVSEAKALDLVYGYCVGLDMTRRDIQGQAKKMARPWDMGKGFDHSAPMTAIRTVADVGHPSEGAIWLKINGEIRQEGDLNQHIWNVPETISYLSGLCTLEPGDLIMMGTPAGVGPVQPGETLEGHVDGVGDLKVSYKK
ncbi:MAG: fumarylacetoacetate hydrolase family protein [Rhodospirillales bacterium]